MYSIASCMVYTHTCALPNEILTFYLLSNRCAYERYWEEQEESLDLRIVDSSVTMDGVIQVLLRGIRTLSDDDDDKNVDLRLNWPVTSIDYSGDKIIIRRSGNDDSDIDGEIIVVDKCIVSVPLVALQQSSIAFTPRLPATKTDAYQMLGMEGACKLLLKFRRPIWPEKLQSVVCSDSFIPEVWFRKFEIPSVEDTTTNEADNSETDNNNVWVAVCYFMSDAAKNVDELGLKKSTEKALDQLSEMFLSSKTDDNYNDSEKNSITIINDVFIESKLYSWTKDRPFIGGGYSYPKVGVQPHHFQSMAQSLDQKLYFCGEHTHLGAPMTVQAAMETGIRAANEVLSHVLIN